MTEWITTLDSLITQGRTFGCLYLDPPWPYKDQATRGATGRHYAPMPIEAIAALPLEQLAAPNSQCHLWITSSFLRHGGDLLEGWGFEPKSQMIWDKDRMGMGNLWRVQHEYLWTGTRGTHKTFRPGARNLPSVYRCPDDPYTRRGEHSRKPDEVRTMVERASVGPYIELFAREQCEGWTSYGNQDQTFVPGTTTQPRCAVCGEPFPQQRRSGKYCGGRCRQRANRERNAKLSILA